MPPIDESGVVTYLLLGAFLIGPLLALTCAIALRFRATRSVQLTTLASCVGAIALAIAILFTRWSLTGKLADFVAVALAYVGYCLIAFLSPLLISRAWLALPVLLLGLIPIGYAYVFSAFVAAFSAPAASTELELSTAAGVCRAAWDFPLGDNLDVEIVWRPKLAPFIERRLDWWKIDSSRVPTTHGRLTPATLRTFCDRRARAE